ncbi:hypothetical protein QYH69_15775 [Paraburkholderia sp. SARCC-3016]|uniref:hypothetical protein n=1 Tax=Paraburkholderia sp. SARCC-3016 TaxID=3058611 RepID=UPI00280788AB|nr:hypothetical protein [Paraburkholderia sp. SARCC-3016]MDQ7978710.1 hypothetical protein [Paraburkholderia sp. SARCC-3016]
MSLSRWMRQPPQLGAFEIARLERAFARLGLRKGGENDRKETSSVRRIEDGLEELVADREGKVTLHKEMRIIFSPAECDDLTSHFRALTDKIPLRPIQTEADYDHAVRTLNALLDAGAADESHELAGLAAVLGSLISEYENTAR